MCLDERGWDENPLVYCDGDGCNVAVHQGIRLVASISILTLNNTRTFLCLLLTEAYTY